MTLSLKAEVLDNFAKDKGHANWIELLDDWKSAFDHHYVPVDISDVVELALAAKQAEVKKEINKLIDEDCFVDNHDANEMMTCKTCANTKVCAILRKLEKRLQAKSEEKVLNNSKT